MLNYKLISIVIDHYCEFQSPISFFLVSLFQFGSTFIQNTFKLDLTSQTAENNMSNTILRFNTEIAMFFFARLTAHAS